MSRVTEEKVIGQPLGGIQLNVLVAEDNKMSARILDMLIKKAGHQCTIAPDGKQAIEHYSKANYDIIFMDCRMPIIDGWEATRLIRESETRVSLPPVGHSFNKIGLISNTFSRM